MVSTTSILLLGCLVGAILSFCTAQNKQDQARSASNKLCGMMSDYSYTTTRTVPSLSHAIVSEEILSSQQTDKTIPEVGMKKKKRAPTNHVASIALTDLVKYFGIPITEASRNLKVGVTVLKRKCREFGIPRWPHRKIKSLDSLIHNLQEEAERQERENKEAARAVMKRQRMLEREREGIERKPFMEIQTETKRFRQDVFRRRHRARALNNNTHSSPSQVSTPE